MGLKALVKEVAHDVWDWAVKPKPDPMFEIASRNIDKALYWQARAECFEKHLEQQRGLLREVQAERDGLQSQILELKSTIGVLSSRDRDAA